MFEPTWLYVKRHSKTGLLYFGKTKKDPHRYPGSGQYWKNHCDKHGWNHVETIQVRLFRREDRLVRAALKFSKKHDIVNARNAQGKKVWANMVDENGLDGGHPVGSYSAESRKAMSKAHRGRLVYNDGVREFKLESGDPKIRELRLSKGQLWSHRINSGLGLRGLKRSQETRDRVSAAKKGVKLNLSESQRALIRMNSAGESNGMWGRTHTDKVKRKLAKLGKEQMLTRNPMKDPKVAAKISALQKGSGNAAFGKVWFNDGKKNFYLEPNDKASRGLNSGMMPRVYWYNNGKCSMSFTNNAQPKSLGLTPGKLQRKVIS